MRLLYIEDSEHLRKPVIKALKASGYAVDDASDGEEGLWLARTNDFDVIILDLMLPKIDGLKILETLRNEDNEAPILILSAKDTVEDRVRGLRLGADDYLIKPFAIDELLARIETLSRRTYQKRTSAVTVGDLTLDSATKSATRAGKPLTLAPKQFALLEHLILRSGNVVSRTDIEAHIYDANAEVTSNVIDAAISGLRKVIAVNEDSKPLIHTLRGHGYILEERDS
jgi:DNA-binding response OmpR family regulator